MKPDMKKRGSEYVESLYLFEPLLFDLTSRHRAGLSDLAIDFATKTAGLRRSLPPEIAAPLARLVRSMNCYYSNLIEDHDTHPVEIERALEGDYDKNPQKRLLQLEARAHIAVQAWIDEGGIEGRALTTAALCEIHERFCSLLPDDLLWSSGAPPQPPTRVLPGALRTDNVQVGRHVAVSAGMVPHFLGRFEEAYSGLGRIDAILSAATAHHRFLWVHPFPDGNGRVARLMTDAVLREVLDTGGIWCVARGLARNENAYEGHLAACDQTRRNDLDGRGQLSEEALAMFTTFFLTTCMDQIEFMESLVQPDRLRDRILIWVEEEIRGKRLPSKASAVLGAVLHRGELPRRDVAGLTDAGERQARRVTSALIHRGALSSESTRAPLRIAFPADLASRWLPGLFPDRAA